MVERGVILREPFMDECLCYENTMAVFSIEGWNMGRRTLQMVPKARQIQHSVKGWRLFLELLRTLELNNMNAIIISDKHVAQKQDRNKMWTSSCAQFIFISTIYFGSIMNLI